MWGYKFLFEISENLKLNNLNYYSINELIPNAIQSNIKNIPEKEHLIVIDGQKIQNIKNTENLIKNFYNKDFFDENTKIHIKLKVNLREYLIISGVAYPCFIKWDKKEKF